MEPPMESSTKKESFFVNDDRLIIVILISIASIYILTAFLVAPSELDNCTRTNPYVVQAANGAVQMNIDQVPRNKFCVFKRVVQEKCIVFNQHLTICNNNIVNSVLQDK